MFLNKSINKKLNKKYIAKKQYEFDSIVFYYSDFYLSYINKNYTFL